MVSYARERGFTLIELLVVIAIIAILAAILFPVFARAREKARQTTCSSNQRQIVASVLMYMQDHDETFPNSSSMWQSIAPDPGVLVCPTLGKTTPNGYIYSAYLAGVALGKINDPTTEMVTADGLTLTSSGIPNVGQYLIDLDQRHTNQYICSMVDGHVQMSVWPISLNAPFWAANGGVQGSQNMLWYDPLNYNPSTGVWLNTAISGVPSIPLSPGPLYGGSPLYSATQTCSPPPIGNGLNGKTSVYFPAGNHQFLLGDFNKQLSGNALVTGNFAAANSYFVYSSWIAAKTDSYFTMMTMDTNGGSASRIEGGGWFGASPIHVPPNGANLSGDFGTNAVRGVTPLMYDLINTSSGTLAWFNGVQMQSFTGYLSGSPTWYLNSGNVMSNMRYLDIGMEANLPGTNSTLIGGPDESGDLYMGDIFIWPIVPTGITTQTRQFIESYLHRKYAF